MTSTIANRPSIPPGFRLKADGSYVPEALVSDIDKLRDQTIETLIDQAKVISTRCGFKGARVSSVHPTGFSPQGGWFVRPEALVSDIDKLRDQTIETLIDQAKVISTLLADFKVRAFRDIEAFVETSVEQYGVKSRSVKGNLTLTSFSGRYMIRLQIQDRLVFDERLHGAKTLIDECITSWSEDSRDEIKVLVNDAFRVDKAGQINTARVLGLRRHLSRMTAGSAPWPRSATA